MYSIERVSSMYLAIAFTKEKINLIYTVRACVNTVEGGRMETRLRLRFKCFPPAVIT